MGRWEVGRWVSALKNHAKTGKNVRLSLFMTNKQFHSPIEVESKIRIMVALTHILSKESCFLLKSFHFRRLQKP